MGKITFHDKNIIKKFFNEGGYVLDFSNRTFDEFTFQSVGVKIQERYGLSKGKSLEAFIDEFSDNIVIKLIQDLLIYYRDLPDNSFERNETKDKQAKKIEEKINRYIADTDVIMSQDEVYIDEGGFAEVYFQKSTQLIVKRLKKLYLHDDSIKSRFKREFQIMKDLSHNNGVIKVYTFNEQEYSYTMEKAETTLYDFIEQNDLEQAQILNILFQILTIMSEVHSQGVLHRDLSPRNIFFLNGLVKISDFGLAKDYKVEHSHLTMNTNNYGQFYYCAPEQLSSLKNSTKMSDVYSLGKIVNFCFTRNPMNDEHVLRSFTQKAISENPELRFKDAGEMLKQLSRHLEIYHQKNSRQIIISKISSRDFDETVIIYFNNISASELCKELITVGTNYKLACFKFMKINSGNATFLLNKIYSTFKTEAKTFSQNDIFASLAFDVLIDDGFDFLSKEIAAKILHYVAWEVNRFTAQRLINTLKENSIEPILENILDGLE